ncbi:MAG: acyl-CoA oxidase [Saprospiraceae bacterium]|nr:MAG: acyl-CoA oxidase [Saprospiraceae bacterium]
MNANTQVHSVYSPGIRALLPLLYAAWSDRVLTPTEVNALRQKAGKLTFLSSDDKKMLLGWSNPMHPPPRQLFKFWEIELREAANLLGDNAKYTLVDLGLKMATEVVEEKSQWDEAVVRGQLAQLEAALKLVNSDTYRAIFPEKTEAIVLAEERSKASFPVAEMRRALDDDYVEIRDKVRTILKDPIFRFRTMRKKSEYRAQVLAWCKLLAEQGLGNLSYPQAYGGKDDMGLYAAVFETLGYHDLSLAIKFGVQFGLFGGSVLWLGTERHHKKYLAKTGTLELAGCFAMTETGHGSNVRGLETTAIYNHDSREFIVNTPNREAGKEYIGNALHGQMATVFAQLIVGGESQGVHAILVPLRGENGNLLPGIEVEDCGYKLGLNGVDNGRIWFHQVRVPKENLLNRFGDLDENGTYQSPIESPSRRFFTMLGTLVGGRVCVPRTGLSAAKSALTIAVKYALKRRQFSGSNVGGQEMLLLDYQSHQRRLMPYLAKAYALDFALTYLTKRYTNRSDKDIREIETLAAGMKAYATWFTTAAIQECREACGGKGYLFENRFADLKADSDIFTTFEGDNTVLMQLVARGVLSEFRKEFHEEGTWAMLRYVGDRVSTAISELNPIAIRNTDKDHLLSPEFQLSAFQFREKQLLYSLSQRIRGLVKGGMNAFDAALTCQTHMLALAEAFIERIVLEQFQISIAHIENDDLRPILNKLSSLYALHSIELHKGWYLEKDYLAGVKTKAIRKLVDELCLDLRQDATALVEAFAIPDELLAAEIIVGPEYILPE